VNACQKERKRGENKKGKRKGVERRDLKGLQARAGCAEGYFTSYVLTMEALAIAYIFYLLNNVVFIEILLIY
jgi:hypothetical protein